MRSDFGDSVPFFKMHGSGNHFVLLDNRNLAVAVADMADWARAVCRDGFGVGADGLIFLEEAPGSDVDYRWHFYNADGSRAEMCGNGSRCAARLAYELGMAGAGHAFGTDAGPIRAEVDPGSRLVKVQLTEPSNLELDLELEVNGQPRTMHFVNTGVPHAVVVCTDVAAVNVAETGRAVRMHPRFAPAGTNVNFIQVLDRGRMHLRTYERGVEAETFACGTGAAASVVTAHALDLCGPQVEVTTTGSEILQISIENDTVFLQGEATLAFEGRMYLDSLGIPRQGQGS